MKQKEEALTKFRETSKPVNNTAERQKLFDEKAKTFVDGRNNKNPKVNKLNDEIKQLEEKLNTETKKREKFFSDANAQIKKGKYTQNLEIYEQKLEGLNKELDKLAKTIADGNTKEFDSEFNRIIKEFETNNPLNSTDAKTLRTEAKERVSALAGNLERLNARPQNNNARIEYLHKELERLAGNNNGESEKRILEIQNEYNKLVGMEPKAPKFAKTKPLSLKPKSFEPINIEVDVTQRNEYKSMTEQIEKLKAEISKKRNLSEKLKQHQISNADKRKIWDEVNKELPLKTEAPAELKQYEEAVRTAKNAVKAAEEKLNKNPITKITEEGRTKLSELGNKADYKSILEKTVQERESALKEAAENLAKKSKVPYMNKWLAIGIGAVALGLAGLGIASGNKSSKSA